MHLPRIATSTIMAKILATLNQKKKKKEKEKNQMNKQASGKSCIIRKLLYNQTNDIM